MTCISCRWAHREIEDPNPPSALQCRRYPPTVVELVPVGDGCYSEKVQAWPRVGEGDYCGEWTYRR